MKPGFDHPFSPAEKLARAEEEIARLENITRIQAKQIERLMDARDAEIMKRGPELPHVADLHGAFPLVLYFPEDRERAEFIELIKLAKPHMITRNLP